MRRAALLPLIVCALALTGCAGEAMSAPPATTPAPSTPSASAAAAAEPVATPAPAGRPQVGDCWQESDYAVVGAWTWWQGGAAVGCSGTHHAETIAVADLPAGVAYPEVPAAGAGDGTTAVSDELTAAARAACTAPLGDALPTGTRVTWQYYLPSPEQWAGGDRWVRCDLTVRGLGPVASAAREALTVPATQVVAEAATTWRLCLDTPGDPATQGPWAGVQEGTIVDCAGVAQWAFGADVPLTGAVWPGDEALKAQVAVTCDAEQAAAGRASWWAYWPDQQSWDAGRRVGSCWLH